jgi:hypothetical protein
MHDVKDQQFPEAHRNAINKGFINYAFVKIWQKKSGFLQFFDQ